jgi:hypothetical protein
MSTYDRTCGRSFFSKIGSHCEATGWPAWRMAPIASSRASSSTMILSSASHNAVFVADLSNSAQCGQPVGFIPSPLHPCMHVAIIMPFYGSVRTLSVSMRFFQKPETQSTRHQ